MGNVMLYQMDVSRAKCFKGVSYAHVFIEMEGLQSCVMIEHCTSDYIEYISRILKFYFNCEEKVRELLSFNFISWICDAKEYEKLKQSKLFDENKWRSLTSEPDIKINIKPPLVGAGVEFMITLDRVYFKFEPQERRWYYKVENTYEPLENCLMKINKV